MKTSYNLYIDVELIKLCKAKNISISPLVNHMLEVELMFRSKSKDQTPEQQIDLLKKELVNLSEENSRLKKKINTLLKHMKKNGK